MFAPSIVLAGFLVGSTPLQAATLTIVPDKSSYQLGESVVVEILGDSEGALDRALFARLRFDPAILEVESVDTVTLTASGGLLTWSSGPKPCGAGSCDILNEVSPLIATGTDIDQVGVLATVTLAATALGTTELRFETLAGPETLGFQLDFFGLTTLPGASINVIAPPVPLLGPLLWAALAASLIGVAAWRRSKAQGASPHASR